MCQPLPLLNKIELSAFGSVLRQLEFCHGTTPKIEPQAHCEKVSDAPARQQGRLATGARFGIITPQIAGSIAQTINAF